MVDSFCMWDSKKIPKFLINENLVRGGIDQDEAQSFPWISRLTSLGTKLVEDEK